MPRGRLNEKHVQRVAVDWLASYYADKVSVRAVHADTETAVSAKSRLGSGRADGLVASLMSDGTAYTAALEAKSARTLPNIMLRYGDDEWLLHALIAGLFGLLLAGSIGWFFSEAWFFRWVLPVVTFFGVAIAYLFFTRQHARYRLIDVVRQVKRYPANEQWVAVSADAYNEIADDLKDALRTDCRREGIGLLRVRSATQVTPLETPKSRRPPKGLEDFLQCYARSNAVRQRLRTIAESPE
jgi:hypothetical protein